MWNTPTQKQLDKIPRLYETEGVPVEEKIIHMHFFIGGCDWYVTEFDGKDTFFGFAILNNDYEMAEWGYISFQELKDLRLPMQIDRDMYWKPCRANEVEKICMAQGWPYIPSAQVGRKEEKSCTN